MQPSSPVVSFANLRHVRRQIFLVSAEMRAVQPVVNPQAVVRVARAVGAAASVAAGSCRGAKPAAFGKRWVRGAPAFAPDPASSPNPAVKRDWPSAASVGCRGMRSSAPSLPCVAASPLPPR